MERPRLGTDGKKECDGLDAKHQARRTPSSIPFRTATGPGIVLHIAKKLNMSSLTSLELSGARDLGYYKKHEVGSYYEKHELRELRHAPLHCLVSCFL